MCIRPIRLQLSRRAGFVLQEVSRAANGLEAVNVTRGGAMRGLFGNPCVCQRPHGCPHDPGFDRADWEDEHGNVDPLRCCVAVYRHYVETGLRGEPTRTGRFWFAAEGMAGYPHRTKLIAALPMLAGKNLACWCPLPAPGEPDICHAAVLLELANPEKSR